MTAKSPSIWDTWDQLVLVQRSAFRIGRDQREEWADEFRNFLKSFSEIQPPPPDWFRKETEETLSLLRLVASCDRIADQSKSQSEQAQVYVRGFLSSRKALLIPLSEDGARGYALTMMISPDDRLKAATRDPIAFDIACRYASCFIERGEALTPKWASFASDVLSGRLKRPIFRRGKKSYANVLRDQTIRDALSLGQELGLPPTRNDESAPLSGCDVVAAFFCEIGMFPTTFAGVKRVWLSRGEEKDAFQRTMKGD